MAGFNVSNFMGEMDKAGGFARPDRYEVWIYTGELFSNLNKLYARNIKDYFGLFGLSKDLSVMQRLIMFCERAEMPGFQFATDKARIYGPEFTQPTMQQYQDITLSFYVGSDMFEKFFFDAWMFSIADAFTNDFNYRNEYATSIDIAQYDETGYCTYVSHLLSAHPVALNQLELSYSDSDAIHKLGVTFTYKKAVPVEVGDRLESLSAGGGKKRGARESFNQTVTKKAADPTQTTNGSTADANAVPPRAQ